MLIYIISSKGVRSMDKEQKAYVLRHSSKRDKELKYDFMPSMLEIIERPAHKAGTVIILGVFTSSGTMQPVGNISSLNTYTSGTVKSINVEEGAYVKAGDVLIELDTQSIDIDVEALSQQKEVLEAQKEIYTMIKNSGIMTLFVFSMLCAPRNSVRSVY